MSLQLADYSCCTILKPYLAPKVSSKKYLAPLPRSGDCRRKQETLAPFLVGSLRKLFTHLYPRNSNSWQVRGLLDQISHTKCLRYSAGSILGIEDVVKGWHCHLSSKKTQLSPGYVSSTAQPEKATEAPPPKYFQNLQGHRQARLRLRVRREVGGGNKEG